MDKNEFLKREPNLALARRLNAGVIVLTVIVFGLVGAMRREQKIALPDGLSTDFLPLAYSLINLGVALALIVAVVLIRRGNVAGHRLAINTALAGSLVFLIGYVIYHFTNVETRFGNTGPVRVVYLFFLITHVVLAAISFPFILYTWVLGTTNQFARHRRLARFVFPVWLYVALTGPLCYFLLHTLGT